MRILRPFALPDTEMDSEGGADSPRPEALSTMAWFRRKERTFSPIQAPQRRINIPDGLIHKCPKCMDVCFIKDYEDNIKVCPRCNFHERLNARERIAMLTDEGSFEEYDANLISGDPLKFTDRKPYPVRLEENRKASGCNEAVITGYANVEGRRVSLAVMEPNFIMGSMGSVVGEKITRSMERGIQERIPVVNVCVSGGARMMEGILSLMQMAKTSILCAEMERHRVPYIIILTNPTTAGVMASYASLGDVIIAEPGCMVGFAGPRVIEQTIRQILPKGFQTAEFVMQHGFIDCVVHRRDLKPTLARFLRYFHDGNKGGASNG